MGAAPTRAELLERIVEWARREPRLRALIQTGSGARGDGRFDEHSDLDLELVTPDIAWLEGDSGWYRAFAPVMVALELENEPDEEPTRLVFYAGGHKVDFTLADERRYARVAREGRIIDGLYGRGYRVLLDKDGRASSLPAASGAAPARRPPSQRDLDETVADFWFEAAHIPRYLVRGELWVVKFRDWTMKCDLLQVLEWRAALQGRDPWHIGSHMRDWLDEATWRELHETFAPFDAAGSWQALIASTRVFGRVGRETAELAGLAYDAHAEREVGAYIATFAGRLGRS